ncbi:MAG: ankyrin repeat domain-containing protein [Phycisphaeraceae bacterium]|nr:ankyrin repeat domain-containing protein [Phycisphaeraceae bacterium]
MKKRRPYAFLLVVVLLLAFGTVFYIAIERLTREVSPVSKSGPGTATSRQTASAAVLRKAIEDGDIAAIKAELARSGGDINGQFYLLEVGRRQVSLLTYAAMQGSSQTIKALIEAGARPEAASDDWGTPLMMAAAKGDLASMSELIKAGAKVNERNRWGESALFMAVRFGSPDKVRLLLDSGASVRLADNEGNSVLAAAAGGEAPPEILRMLLDAGADPDTANRDGVTPLMIAAKLGDADKCILLLSAGASTTLKDGNGWTALDWARQRSDAAGERCAEVLVQADR